MTETNIFVTATKEHYRFPYNGSITIEDLWDLPFSRKVGGQVVYPLEEIYIELGKELQDTQQEGLVQRRNPADTIVAKKMEIVKFIFETKRDEMELARKAAENHKRRQTLLRYRQEVVDERTRAEIAAMSDEEFEAAYGKE